MGRRAPRAAVDLAPWPGRNPGARQGHLTTSPGARGGWNAAAGRGIPLATSTSPAAAVGTEGEAMFFGFDPVYFVFLAPGILLAAWASWRVRRAYVQADEIPPESGFTGAETAEAILDRHGLREVRVEPVEGFLSDHYDP